MTMSSEDYAEKYIKKDLWGYAPLVTKFLNDVRPALVEARDSKKVQREKEEQEGRELGHINTDPPHLTSDGRVQGMYPTVSDPPTPSDSPGVKPDNSHVTEIEVLQDSQAEPDDHVSRPAIAGVGKLEEPDPTTPDVSQ